MNHQRQGLRVVWFVSLLSGLIAVPSSAWAADLSNLYDDSTLNYWGTRYAASTGRLLEAFRAQYFNARERRALADVNVEFPLQSATDRGDPFSFYSAPAHSPPQVFMPVLSMHFLDEICIAQAWLQVNDYNIETISDYVAMLKYRPARRFPRPLDALQIRDPLQDDRVASLSLRLFNSLRAFSLFHELGHVYLYKETGVMPVTFEEKRRNEEAADRFAFEMMRRDGEVPVGIVLYFMYATHFEPYQGDYRSDAEWREYLKQTDHPLTAGRIRVLAGEIAEAAQDYGANNAELVRSLAAELGTFAGLLADTDVQRSIRIAGEATDLASLAPRRKGELIARPAGQSPAANGALAGYYAGTIVRNVAGGSTETLDAEFFLRRQGERVSGRYAFGQTSRQTGYATNLGVGRISGTVDGDTMYFDWESGNTSGRGTLTANANGNGFSGQYGYGESSDGGGRFSAQRSR